MATPESQDGFFASWDIVKWALAAIWTAGFAVVGFVWRLSTRIEILEHEAEMREAADDRRHAENVHILRGLQQQLRDMTSRIDNMFTRSGGRKWPDDGE